MKTIIERTTKIVQTYRVAKVQGMFDIPASDEETFRVEVDLPIETKPWQLGLITGASGSGKSTIARELFADEYREAGHAEWSDSAIVNDFPKALTPSQITGLLTSVGLSSAPAWLRPYRVLSTGQQFRADLARSLAEIDAGELVVFDEFTSTVDRTVAKAVSVSVAKYLKRSEGARFVAVTCHRDIEEWLQPDWVFDTDLGEFRWGSVQPRPTVTIEIREGVRESWKLFHQHHYLTANLSPSARVFLAYVKLGDDEERLAGFFSILPVMGHKGWWRFHRTVVLPDFQGMGIGNRSVEAICEQLWRAEHKRTRSTTSSPNYVAHRRRNPGMWRLAEAPTMKGPAGKTSSIKSKGKLVTSAGRLTTNWVYVPEELRK